MEGVPAKADAQQFTTCISLVRRNPYILKLALSAGLGGLLFGYDTGVISGALLYIRDDFKSVDRSTTLQETIVSTAVAGAIVGAAAGGWMNDRFGRRTTLFGADIVFVLGAILMCSAPFPALLIAGRVCVGLGIGMASMTSPLYISEASPAKVRGALVSTNGFLITGGQFLSYLINLAFTKGREEEALAILRKLYPPEEVEGEIIEFKRSIEAEIEEHGSQKIQVSQLWKVKEVRLGLIAGVGIQIFQQFVGINTVMYYSPTIVQLAGFASNSTALLLSLITSGLNAAGSIVSIYLIDRSGRKKLLIVSLVGVVISLALLSAVFHETAEKSPLVSRKATDVYSNYTCPDYKKATAKWDCMECLKTTRSITCGFCAAKGNELLPGACLRSNSTVKDACHGAGRSWFTRGCPSHFGWLALIGLALYIIFFSPGMGTVPWIINAEIYPLRYRGTCGGIAATANWIANLIVAQTFLTLTVTIGTSMTFGLFGILALIGLIFVLIFVPETKGLSLEEVELMLQKRLKRFSFRFWVRNDWDKNDPDDSNRNKDGIKKKNVVARGS